jgi:hypothetical protein
MKAKQRICVCTCVCEPICVWLKVVSKAAAGDSWQLHDWTVASRPKPNIKQHGSYLTLLCPTPLEECGLVDAQLLATVDASNEDIFVHNLFIGGSVLLIGFCGPPINLRLRQLQLGCHVCHVACTRSCPY